jgi:hypothetical protein
VVSLTGSIISIYAIVLGLMMKIKEINMNYYIATFYCGYAGCETERYYMTDKTIDELTELLWNWDVPIDEMSGYEYLATDDLDPDDYDEEDYNYEYERALEDFNAEIGMDIRKAEKDEIEYYEDWWEEI